MNKKPTRQTAWKVLHKCKFLKESDCHACIGHLDNTDSDYSLGEIILTLHWQGNALHAHEINTLIFEYFQQELVPIG